MKQAVLFLAVSILSTVVSFAQDTADLLQQGNQALKNQDYQTAIGVFTRILEREPDNGQAVYNRAVCYLATNQTDKAFDGLNTAIGLNSNYAPAYLNRGAIYVQKKEFAGAISDFTRVIELDGKNSAGWYMRGQIHLQTGAIPDAVRDLRQVLAREAAGPRVDRVNELLTLVGFPAVSGEVRTFVDKEETISIELPKEWHVKLIDDGKSLNMFVSLQKIEKESDMFLVGATIRRIRGMSKSFEGVQSDGQWLAGFWSGALDESAKEAYQYKVISSKEHRAGQFIGIVREQELQHKPEFYKVKMYEIVVGHDDDIVTMNLEAPAVLFDEYQPIFERAIRSLVIKQ